jgi:hypothetical protein
MSIPANALTAGMCSKFLFAAVLSLGASGCGEQPEPSWSSDSKLRDSKLVRSTFTLGGTSYAIVLPEAAVVGHFGDEVSFDLSKNRRVQGCRVATVPTAGSVATYDQRKVFANGARLQYHIDHAAGGGSGGPHAELSGRMEIGSHVLWVNSWDQHEGYRYPGWCVPYLARVEIVEPTAGTAIRNGAH